MKYVFPLALAFACLCTIGLHSCGPADKHLAEIEKLEKVVRKSEKAAAENTGTLDSLALLHLARKQLSWASSHNKDTARVRMFLKAGYNFQRLGDPRQAYFVFGEILKGSPTHPLAEQAMYEMATIAHVDLHEHEAALTLYKAYLAQYPEGKHNRVAREGIVFFETLADTTNAALLDSIRARNPSLQLK